MTETPDPAQKPAESPTRRERLRPVELLIFAAILAVFAGVVVLVVTRQLETTAIAVGAAFIGATMLLALLGLGGKPNEEDLEARKDLQRPEDGGSHWH